MGWITEDNLHEGFAVPVFTNGDRGTGTTNAGSDDWVHLGDVWDDEVAVAEAAVRATGFDERGRSFYRAPDWTGRPNGHWRRRVAEVIGWQILCDCSPPEGGRRPTSWEGPVFTRVPSVALHEPAAGRIFAADEDVAYICDEESVEAALIAAWKREHAAAADCESAIRDAAAEADRTKRELDKAVAVARAQGLSWEAIGAAAGMARSSAWERWRHVIE